MLSQTSSQVLLSPSANDERSCADCLALLTDAITHLLSTPVSRIIGKPHRFNNFCAKGYLICDRSSSGNLADWVGFKILILNIVHGGLLLRQKITGNMDLAYK